MPATDFTLPATADWSHRHLLGIEQLSAADIRSLLQTARCFANADATSLKQASPLEGCVIANLFFEPSTRTKSSFFLAASRLGADILDFSADGSSVTKGETVVDTARNIHAMGVELIICRHQASGVPHRVAEALDCSIINAGDGQHEHPTQALLDLYTIAERCGRTDFDLTGLNVAIVGDILHSRVARSGINGLKKLGANVILVGPPTLLPKTFEQLDCEVHDQFDPVLDRLDVCNMLRVQFERITSQAFPSVREYTALYGLNDARFARMKKEIVIMHPGPINRDIELASSIADSPNAAILQQVRNGLAVRTAAIYLCHQASR